MHAFTSSNLEATEQVHLESPLDERAEARNVMHADAAQLAVLEQNAKPPYLRFLWHRRKQSSLWGIHDYSSTNEEDFS